MHFKQFLLPRSILYFCGVKIQVSEQCNTNTCEKSIAEQNKKSKESQKVLKFSKEQEVLQKQFHDGVGTTVTQSKTVTQELPVYLTHHNGLRTIMNQETPVYQQQVEYLTHHNGLKTIINQEISVYQQKPSNAVKTAAEEDANINFLIRSFNNCYVNHK